MEDVDIEKVLLPKTISFGDTLLVTCTVDYKVKRLHIMLPKTTVYVKTKLEKLNWYIFWLKMMFT